MHTPSWTHVKIPRLLVGDINFHTVTHAERQETVAALLVTNANVMNRLNALKRHWSSTLDIRFVMRYLFATSVVVTATRAKRGLQQISKNVTFRKIPKFSLDHRVKLNFNWFSWIPSFRKLFSIYQRNYEQRRVEISGYCIMWMWISRGCNLFSSCALLRAIRNQVYKTLDRTHLATLERTIEVQLMFNQVQIDVYLQKEKLFESFAIPPY